MPGPIQRLAELARRIRFYLYRERFERELAEEMRFHVEMKARDHEQAGMSRDDAQWAARRRFGNPARLRDETGDVMAVGWVEAASQDVRYALRSLRRSPAFTAVAVASVALGIGATTAIFTLVNVILLRPLPFPQASRLVLGFQTATPGVFFPVDSIPWSYPKYLRLREMVPAFEALGYSSWDEYNLRRTGVAAGSATPAAARVRAELVTTNLFATLGARAMIGRTISAADSAPSEGGAAAVLSEPLWRAQFAADSGVVGTTAVLDKVPITVVGVMPARFTGIRESIDMWVPLRAVRELDTPVHRDRYEHGMGAVVARLAPNGSLAAADAQLKQAARTLNTMFPAPRFGPNKSVWSAGAVGYGESRRHPLIVPLLLVLSIAVVGVLLIVCANLAGLLLARARAREAELGIRVALGAGRGRLVRQMMTESMVLATLGGIPGLLIGYGGAVALAHLRPTLPPNYVLLRAVDILQGVSLVPDWRVVSFALALTLVVGVLFGMAPAVAASRTNIAELIKVAANRGGTSRARGRRSLVVGQVALATTLLVGAGLMVRSFRALLQSNMGFAAANTVMLSLSGGDSAASTPARRTEMLAAISALPGVEAAAASNCAPLSSGCGFMPVTRVDNRRSGRGELAGIEVHAVTGDFFHALGIPLRAGRQFDSRDVPGRVTAALINESAARVLWRGESPIGRRLSTFSDDTVPTVEVIGVVADAKYETLEAPARPAVYYKLDQFSQFGGSDLVIRGRGDVGALLPAIRRVIVGFDPTVAIHRVTTGDAMLARATSGTRFVATLLVAFGVGAALLAALGVYGVLAYLVSQRRREFGVRMAIGAQPSSLLALVVRQGVALTAVGLAIGVAGAMAATRLLTSFLFGVARSDVLTYVVIVVVVGIAGVLAALIPGRRATQVDPIIALRE
jgi:predicted permease